MGGLVHGSKGSPGYHQSAVGKKKKGLTDSFRKKVGKSVQNKFVDTSGGLGIDIFGLGVDNFSSGIHFLVQESKF